MFPHCRHLIWVSCLLAGTLQAQTLPDEDFFAAELVSEDPSDHYEYLLELFEHPVNVNTAAREELLRIPGMTGAAVDRVIAARAVAPFRTAGDVQRSLGQGRSLWQRIAGTMRLQSDAAGRRWRFRFRSRAESALERARGYREGQYPGSRLKQYNRLLFDNGGTIEGGVLVEKDAGETNFRDHVAGYVSLNNALFGHRVVAGYYTLEIGQGVLFWRNAGFGKGGDAVFGARRSGRGAVGYKSTDELGGFLGAAVQRTGRRWEYVAFGSIRDLDANINSEGFVTSLYGDGYHRTATEQLKDGALTEKMAGAHLRGLVSGSFEIGGSAAWFGYDRAFTVSTRDPYRFAGQQLSLYAMDFRGTAGRVDLFGEAAVGDNGAYGAVTGAVVDFNATAVSTVLRSYQRDFHSFYGRAFGDRSENRNEEGLYLGVRHQANPWLEINAYHDMVRYPAVRYFVQMPSTGSESAAYLRLKPAGPDGWSLRLRQRRSARTVTVENPDDSVRPELVTDTRREARCDWDRTWTPRFQSRCRLEWAREAPEAEGAARAAAGMPVQGLAGYLDLTMQPSKRLLCAVRATLFGSMSGPISFYAYERHVPGVFSSRQLRGDGSRFYVLLRGMLAGGVSCAARYDLTQYSDRDVVGSGYDTVTGSHVSRVAVQLDWEM